MEEYDITNLEKENLMIFVVATAGQGDTPYNMKTFWRHLLLKSLPTNLLENLRYGVLGLGDSSFEKFNFAAKKLNKRLGQLGATEIVEIGLADDQHDLGLDAVFLPWVQELFQKISEQFQLQIENSAINNDSVIERFDVSVIANSKKENPESDIYVYEATKNKKSIMAKVIQNIRMTDIDHFQDVRLIKFYAPTVKYAPGDVLYIKAKNSDEQVSRLFDILNTNGVDVHPEMLIQVKEKEIKLPTVLEPNLTLKQIAQQYWDLSFKPKRSTIHTLAQISENDLEKEKLVEFTTAEGQEEFFNYINRPRRNILELLNDFPYTTSKLNINLLFEILSPIKPRAFSIASSSKANTNEIHIIVAVVKYKTKLVEPRLGLCSNWLASLKHNQEIVFWHTKGTFKFDYSKPMILVGPGTGLAPFRSLLADKAIVDKDLSSCILFFGCRYKNKDWLCKEDLNEFEKSFGLKVFYAFSRDQENKL